MFLLIYDKNRIHEDESIYGKYYVIEGKLLSIVPFLGTLRLQKSSTFLDLMPDFQTLINYDAIPKFGGSQNSNSSTSKKSWVEEEVSGSKMRKDFEDMVPRHQRRLTEDIYDSITNAASDLNLDVDDLLLYLAMRSCYHKDRKKKMAFDDPKS